MNECIFEVRNLEGLKKFIEICLKTVDREYPGGDKPVWIAYDEDIGFWQIYMDEPLEISESDDRGIGKWGHWDYLTFLDEKDIEKYTGESEDLFHNFSPKVLKPGMYKFKLR